MKNLIAGILLVAASCSHAYIDTQISNKITSIIQTNLPGAHVGVVLQDLDTGKKLYEYRANESFTPASTTKLFSAAAALLKLGPNYKFKTRIYYDKQGLNPERGELRGDVAIKFSGDPSLQTNNLRSLLKNLLQAKVKVIHGDLWIDDTIFTGPDFAFGWTIDATPWYYAAPTSAVVINGNQFGVTLYPGQELGASAKAQFDPRDPFNKGRKLHTDVTTVTAVDSEQKCQLIVNLDEYNNVDLGGCWPVGQEPQNLRLAVKNPRHNFTQILSQVLQEMHIQLRGKIKFAAVPKNLNQLAFYESEPLSNLLVPVLADSNNLYADNITKVLGAKMYGKGSFKTGTLAIKEVISAKAGIDFQQIRLEDGSGESRYNLVTPQHLARLLYVMHNEEQLSKHFRDSLALSGVNGTMRKRLSTFDARGTLNAKTGTLTGVSTLAGYLSTRAHKSVIVSVMVNATTASASKLKEFENELCYFLVNQV